ncbi:uncharacterized protein [Ptychodera flava]|uniref:uncharacterized protein n=1 Tax=Ptychodera flava TaxID=63121 RepID=UPI00396A3733
MKITVSCILVFIISSAAVVRAQHREVRTCALSLVTNYENGVINMEITPNQPCPSNPGRFFKNKFVDPPSSTTDYYLTSSNADGKLRAVLVPKDTVDTVELGEKISDESLECKRCREYKYEDIDDAMKYYCYPVEKCPSRISDGVYWNPAVGVAFTRPSRRCFYDVCGETDIYYCKESED